MKEAMRKMYLSIITSVLVLVVTCTTTYAWTGILSYSSIEEFNVGLKQEERSDYSLLISLDGVNFSYGLNVIDVKKSILNNMGIDISGLNDSVINAVFDNLSLDPITTKMDGNNIGKFVDFDDIISDGFSYSNVIEEKESVKKAYYNFDVYLTFDYDKKNPTEEALNDFQSIYLSNVNNLFRGKKKTIYLANPISLANYFNQSKINRITVDSSAVLRLAITKYEAINRGTPVDSNIVDTYLYQGGSSIPTLDSGVYSFGGIMPYYDNLAMLDYNTKHNDVPIPYSAFEEFYNNRNSYENMNGVKDNINSDFWIVTQDDLVNTKKMIKLNIKMWVEGFDADCFEVIANLPVSFNLLFATKKSI